jgi:transcriptional regulator with PAS, ATPase and Fis domain
MKEFKELEELLEKSGKVEKISVYQELFLTCYHQRNKAIYPYFEQFLQLLQDYLEFDPKPDASIKKHISSGFQTVFDFIRNSNDFAQFEHFYPQYQKYKGFISDPSVKAKLFQVFGYFFWFRQNFQESIAFMEQSLELINRTNEIDALPGRYTNLGFLYESRGDWITAEMYYLDGLTFAKKHNSLSALKLAYAALGRLHLRKQNFEKAEMYLKETLALYDESAQDFDRISVISNLAYIYTRLNEHRKALSFLQQGKKDWVKEGNPPLYYSILHNKGICYIELKEFEKAEPNLTEALEFSESAGVIEQIVSCCINLGTLYHKTGKYTEAIDILQKALPYAEESEKEKPHIFYNIGIVYDLQKNYKKAITYYRKAVQFYKKNQDYYNLIKLLRALADCYELRNEHPKAVEALKESWQWQEIYEKQQKEKEEELAQNPLLDTGLKKQYLFKDSNSLLSRELTEQIGIPIIGRSAGILQVIEQALLAAKNDPVSIHIRGESGTGKELIARLIHFASARADKPFIEVNSASLSPSLAESALFGHEKGSFTGAHSKHIGFFQSADKGTIFLDEIGDMPIDIQSKLLRVIETKTLQPLGSSSAIKIDFRLVSATHQDLGNKVENNLFRLDLLNRINTIEIMLPSLRTRKEDIPLIIDYFANSISQRTNRKRPNISGSALNLLCDYDYPGNIRELYNLIERLILFSKKDMISFDDVQIALPQTHEVTIVQKYETLDLAKNEEALIKLAMEKTNNVQVEAAKLLGISPYALLRRLKKTRS